MVRTLLFASLVLLPAAAQPGKDWGIERSTYSDPVTGIPVVDLVGGSSRASNLYYHFSNFTADGRYVILTSDRTGSGQIYRVDVSTGRIVQLTAGSGVAAGTACPHPANPVRLFYARAASLVELDIDTQRERVIGTVPPPVRGSLQQPTVSHDRRSLAVGFARDDRTWEIGLMDIASGAYRRVITQGFRLGHVQHHPSLPRIFYVWETGGYAPQRTWMVDSDGSGNRPFYFRADPKEWLTPLKEWVTHESWVAGTGQMTLIVDKVGILVADPEGAARLLPGDYWHCTARPDGKQIVADDNAGRLWLIETATANRRLLATGLRAGVRGVHAHASFDRTGRYILFNNGRTAERVSLIDLSALPPGDWSRFTP